MSGKKIKVSATSSCTFCNIKNDEIQKLTNKIHSLETENKLIREPKVKVKKELTEEDKKALELKKKERLEKAEQMKKMIEENKKLKDFVLTRFGVDFNNSDSSA